MRLLLLVLAALSEGRYGVTRRIGLEKDDVQDAEDTTIMQQPDLDEAVLHKKMTHRLYYANSAAWVLVGSLIAVGARNIILKFNRDLAPSERRFLRLQMVSIVYFVVGIIYFTQGKGYYFLKAVYFITEIVTTVGYGDIAVDTDAEKIFMSFYVLIGIA
jgi:hypothetical protein